MAVLAVLILAGCSFSEDPEVLTLAGPVFGTEYHVSVVAQNDALMLENLRKGVTEVLEKVDAGMSTWRADSELSVLNQQQDQSQWIAVSPELYRVLAVAKDVYGRSEGAFDVTVGPLVNLWGFGPQARPEVVPSSDEIAAVQAKTGTDRFQLRPQPPAYRANPPQYIDLSAIAKGYAVDQVAGYLDQQGLTAYLVEIGGEIRVKGRKPDGEAWRLAIEEPVEGQRSINRVVALTNHAMATSGDYRNFYLAEGQRFSHTIDPQTGKPIQHDLASVSVIADSCMEADALATAFNVLGYEKASRWAVRENIPAYFIVRGANGFQSYQTPAFSAYQVE